MTDEEVIARIASTEGAVVWHMLVSWIEGRNFVPWDVWSDDPKQETRWQIGRVLADERVTFMYHTGPYTVQVSVNDLEHQDELQAIDDLYQPGT